MAKIKEGFKPIEEILQTNIKAGNISLILDSYEDIFSDFDPRSYGEKALSDDFLNECKKAARDKGLKLELRLLVPKKHRNLKEELKIRRRLRNHFEKHAEEKHREITGIRKQGAMWFAIGTILMLISALFYNKEGFIFRLLEVMMVPAGWFGFWEGLDKIFTTSREKEPDYHFYKKMADCQIYFLSYEE